MATLKIYEERDIVGHVRAMEPIMQGGLKALEDHPLVGNARGVGLIAGVELMADKASRTPFEPAAKAGFVVQDECQKAGIIVRAIGDRIAFTPPLVITRPEIEEMLARFKTALDAATPRLMPA
ncbi:aminotransferase class III-fold pyridoxal phosphate-dependent enzyme [Alsobacter sp. KACC 23698]|uniref:aminotransferase class III-fold pyridoxal phosphate-dependent enzyme n=1 Tax=Alsobacter sp. KACC 23698 TaxID=3149229 RepID=UPI0038783258